MFYLVHRNHREYRPYIDHLCDILEGPHIPGEHDSTLRFASYYADHMVLQRAPQRATVWGYASADDVGSNVTVQLISERDLAVVSTHQVTIKAGK